MPKIEYITGMDIGSRQITTVVGKFDASNNSLEIIAANRTHCEGIKGGLVLDIDKTSEAVRRALESIEEQIKIPGGIIDVHVAVRGHHIQGVQDSKKIGITRTEKEITSEDVESLMQSCRSSQVSDDKEIMIIVPLDYIIDNQAGVPNPVGMEGKVLAVDVYVVTGLTAQNNNVCKSIAKAEYGHEPLTYGLLGLGKVALLPEEIDMGILLVDLGGETTEIAIYHNGGIRFTKQLDAGYCSDMISNDIAYCLRCSRTEAKRLKEEYGVASESSLDDGDTEVEFASVDHREKRKVTKRALMELIKPRLEEIFEEIKKEVALSSMMNDIPHGVVLTGGGSKLKGIEKVAEEVLEVPHARPGSILSVGGNEDIIMDPAYFTAIGLLKFVIDDSEQLRSTERTKNNKADIFSIISGAFEKLFNKF
ncbi:MAG: cell division protein FtsA [Elusimicrobiota bacterium]